MKRNVQVLYIATSVLMVLLAACQSQAQQVRPTATPDPWKVAQTPGAPVAAPAKSGIKEAITAKAPTLMQALALVPESADVVSFTDWARVKTSLGFDASKADLDQAAFVAQVKQKTPFAIYGLQQIDTHAKDWGWGTSDLQWEAATRVGDNPVYLLKLRDDFDLKAITDKLESRGFSKFNYQGATVYLHPAGNKDFDSTTQRAINVTAILPEEKLLILSFQAKSVQAVLDGNASGNAVLAKSATISDLATNLGEVDSGMLAKPSFTCRTMEAMINEQGLSGEVLKNVQASYAGQTVHAYDALGVGYQIQGDKTTARIDMTYAKPEDAKADLPVRQGNIEKGLSLSAQKPYSAFFTLDKAEIANDKHLLFTVTPVENQPKNLWTIFSRLDLAFARCP